ncbi:MAG: LysE family translocator, partial [Pseudomonadota bacterium]
PASMGNPALGIFVLGAAFAFLTFVLKAPVGYFAGQLSLWIRQRPGVLTWVYRVSGFTLLGLGLRLALVERDI